MTNSDPHKELKAMDWRARYDRFLHSDRAAVDTGLGTLKSLIAINSGAIVTCLALAGQVWDKNKALIIIFTSNISFYIWGVGLAIFSNAVAYFYQSAVTQNCFYHLTDVYGVNKPSPKERSRMCKFEKAMAFFMLLAAFISFFMFTAGTYRIATSMSQLTL